MKNSLYHKNIYRFVQSISNIPVLGGDLWRSAKAELESTGSGSDKYLIGICLKKLKGVSGCITGRRKI